jgi:hypothetical protein
LLIEKIVINAPYFVNYLRDTTLAVLAEGSVTDELTIEKQSCIADPVLLSISVKIKIAADLNPVRYFFYVWNHLPILCVCFGADEGKYPEPYPEQLAE